MASKLNLGIKEMYNRAKKAGTSVEDAVSSFKDDLEAKVISVEKSKTPTFFKHGKRFLEFLKDHDVDVKYLLLAIPIIASFLLAKEIQYRQSLNSHANLHQASVAFQLQSWTLPPENNFDVWVTSDSTVSFVNINISYNPSLVKLTHEITTTGGLTRIIKVSSMADANLTGSISIVLGLDPSLISSPPSGTFQVASLTFNTNTPDPNVAATISFNTSQMQFVSTDESEFQLSATNLSLVLNPVVTPSPTPTTGSTSSPTPTSAATNVPTATATATAIPTATPTIVPTTSPTNSSTSGSGNTSGSSGSSGSSGTTAKKGDINGDGKVNITDLSMLLANYNKNTSVGDFNSDGKVDIRDLSILLSNWNK